MTWFLRSMGDHDTHRGELRPDGVVTAVCGLRFTPRPTLTVTGQPPDQQLIEGPLALRGNPPDPEQVCPDCQGRAR